MLLDGEKYACETCIRGHRTAQCQHTDRPLILVPSKGRPVSQCDHCRSLRKSRSLHTRCKCGMAQKMSVQPFGKRCLCFDGKPCTCACKKDQSVTSPSPSMASAASPREHCAQSIIGGHDRLQGPHAYTSGASSVPSAGMDSQTPSAQSNESGSPYSWIDAMLSEDVGEESWSSFCDIGQAPSEIQVPDDPPSTDARVLDLGHTGQDSLSFDWSSVDWNSIAWDALEPPTLEEGQQAGALTSGLEQRSDFAGDAAAQVPR